MNSITRFALFIIMIIGAIWTWSADGFFFHTIAIFFGLQAIAWAFPKEAAQYLRWQSEQADKFRPAYIQAWKASPMPFTGFMMFFGTAPTTVIIGTILAMLNVEISAMGWIGIMFLAFFVNMIAVVPGVGAFFMRRCNG